MQPDIDVCTEGKAELQKKIVKTLILTITRKCNLGCAYCISRQNDDFLTLEKAKPAIDIFLKQGGEKTVIYFGGEPLLEPENLMKIVEYVLRNGKGAAQKLVTNGTIYNPELLGFLRAHNVGIGVSMDGGALAHDLNRRYKDGKGSYAQVSENLAKINPDIILFLVSQHTIEGFADAVASLIDHGHTVKVDFQRWCAWDSKQIKSLSDEIEKLDRSAKSKKYKGKIIVSSLEGCRDGQICLFTDGKIYDCPDIPFLIEADRKLCRTKKDGNFEINTTDGICNICLSYTHDFRKLGKEEICLNLKVKKLFQTLNHGPKPGKFQEICNNTVS